MPPTHAGADRSCPDWQTLLDFHVGRLPQAAREGVETHVRGCTECESILVELAEEPGAEGDSLPDQLLAYLRGGPTPATASP